MLKKLVIKYSHYKFSSFRALYLKISRLEKFSRFTVSSFRANKFSRFTGS